MNAPMGAAQSWTHRLGQVRFVYLGVLPSVATFALVVRGGPTDGVLGMLLFVAGGVFVACYLWALTFQGEPKSWLVAAVQLFAGPCFALASRPAGEDLPALAIRAFLIDGVAMVVALVWLGWTTRPMAGTAPRLVLTFGAAGLLAAVTPLFWPLWHEGDLAHWREWLPLALGVGQSAVFDMRGLKKEQSGETDAFDAGASLGPLLLLWIVSLMAGYGYSSLHGHG